MSSNSRHLVRTADQASFTIPDAFAGLSTGFRRWSIVNGESGSVHQEFNICELEAGGSIDTHVHSFEESIYLMEGELVADTGYGSYLLQEGNFGVFPISTPHAIRNSGKTTARWAEMLSPQPRIGKGGDTFAAPLIPTNDPEPVDPRDPRTLHFGIISRESMNKNLQAQELLALSASMRTALLVYSGITVKMMVDGDLSATQSTMFMVQYEASGKAGEHDHPFEETYMILDGEVTGVFDGQSYRLKPGDVAWAGVGCIHEFQNPTEGVIWLETSAPQPPSRHAYRWARDWNFLNDKLEE